jgi:uncharacterized protein (UPF0335 family)
MEPIERLGGKRAGSADDSEGVHAEAKGNGFGSPAPSIFW